MALKNPLAIATTSKLVNDLDVKQAQKQVTTVIGTLFVLGFGYLGYQQLKRYRKRKFLEKNMGNPDVTAAMIIYRSIHRIETPTFLGIPITAFQIPDGTDEQAIFKITQQVTSLENVQKAYKILYDRLLSTDLNSDLTTSEILAFYNAIKYKEVETNYVQGTPLYVNNPNGTTIYDANGNYLTFREYGYKLGTVIQKIDNRYQYDRRNYLDTFFGNGYVESNEVTSVNPI